MKRLHVIGRKNHGKTTLVCELTERLTQLGVRVGTLKHTHHQHELDTPGKDSQRHRVSGARCAGILSPNLNAVFWNDEPADQPLSGDDRYRAFEPHFADCDLVIVEGDTQTSAVRIEVWRAAISDAPMASSDSSISLVVSDDDCDISSPRVQRSELTACLDWIRRQFEL